MHKIITPTTNAILLILSIISISCSSHDYINPVYNMALDRPSPNYIDEDDVIYGFLSLDVERNQEIIKQKNQSNKFKTAKSFVQSSAIFSCEDKQGISASHCLSTRGINYEDERFFNVLRKKEQPIVYSDSSIVDINSIRNKLGDNDILLRYFVINDNFQLITITNSSVTFYKLHVPVNFVRENVIAIVRLMQSIPSDRSLIKDNSWKMKSVSLYDFLIRPAENEFIEHKHLIIIPDDILTILPFSMLIRSGDLSAEDSVVSTKYFVEMNNIDIISFSKRKRSSFYKMFHSSLLGKLVSAEKVPVLIFPI